jgi:hypothetical protein
MNITCFLSYAEPRLKKKNGSRRGNHVGRGERGDKEV